MRLAARLGASLGGLLGRSRTGQVRRVLRVSRVVSDLGRAERFYTEGLGFSRIATAPLDPALASALALALGQQGGGQHGGADTVSLKLGADEVVLVRWHDAGAAYPADSHSNDCWFQHLAIVVNDMAAAHARVMRHAPRTITTDGPQRLPPAVSQRAETALGQGERAAATGPAGTRVVAFKFRDPDGHPLELIQFPPDQGRAVWHEHAGPGPCLGIDHSALSVGSTPQSLRFYRGLGFRLADRSFNHGPAQAALDGLHGAQVRVSSLRPALDEGPGLELLGYLPPGRPVPAHDANAVLTDWVTLDTGGTAPPRVLRDPDGHLMVLV